MYPFFFKIVHYYDVIFSQNCCFVANFVNKTLVGNSTSKSSIALYQSPHRIFFLYSYQYPQSHSKSKVQILYIAWKNYMKARVILPGIHRPARRMPLKSWHLLHPIANSSFIILSFTPFCREQAKRLHCQSFCRAHNICIILCHISMYVCMAICTHKQIILSPIFRGHSI